MKILFREANSNRKEKKLLQFVAHNGNPDKSVNSTKLLYNHLIRSTKKKQVKILYHINNSTLHTLVTKWFLCARVRNC